MYYIASVSFGKDSFAMLLRLLADNYPLNEVVFFDTGMEFHIIDYYSVQIEEMLRMRRPDIKFTRLKPKKPFEYYMLCHPHKTRKGITRFGYGWCGGLCRWGTTLKTQALDKYNPNAIWYIGIAYDEKERALKYKGKIQKKYPLIDWKMTESDCLKLMENNGYDYDGLYTYLDRISCWCCRNKNLKELKNIKKHMPQYWMKLVKLEKTIGENMKSKPLEEI